MEGSWRLILPCSRLVEAPEPKRIGVKKVIEGQINREVLSKLLVYN